tara:strand:+ start:436 stop:1125 length:690 start_codon:yes stop_codon:yes gene_type:complete
MSNLKRNGKLRWAPSFLRNRGQMTRGQKRALRTWWPDYGITFQHDEVIDLDSHFLHDGPLLIEIGFGMGDHLVHLARSLPEYRVLGIEVHRPGLAAATQKIHDLKLSNVRIMRGDARLILTDHLKESAAQAVIIQFPDPWPDQGDAHRRLVQEGMADVIRRHLSDSGELLIVTDVSEYADHCRAILDQSAHWKSSHPSQYHAHRVRTLYEQKAIKGGREVTELSYQVVD